MLTPKFTNIDKVRFAFVLFSLCLLLILSYEYDENVDSDSLESYARNYAFQRTAQLKSTWFKFPGVR